jgi:hypothetical protein
LLAAWAGSAAAGTPSRLARYKQEAVNIATGAVRGLELTAKVVEQQARARENWKKLFGDDKAPHLETEHLLIYGKVPDRPLKDTGALLEKAYGLAGGALALGPGDSWPGKLTVYLFSERGKFASFLRTVEKRRPEADDLGSFEVRSDFPHVAAGPAPESEGPGVEAQAAEQLASALLARRAGTPVPEWLVAGFGRATSFRAGPPRELSAERRRAARLLLATKASASDVWDGNLKGGAATVLRASLVDFLAYGPGKARFPALLEGYKPAEGMQTRSTPDALRAANIDPQALNVRWQSWARSGR